MDTLGQLENVLREDLQRVILLALSRERFFVSNIFYGGTALRLLVNRSLGSPFSLR